MRKQTPLKALGALPLLLLTSSFIHSDMTCDSAEMKMDKPVEMKAEGHCAVTRPTKKVEMDLRADALFWIASEDGLEFATKSKTISSSNNLLGHGKIEDLSFKWDYGFRTALGFILPERRWDTQAIYTWFHDRAKGHSSASNSYILPTFASSTLNTDNQQAANSAKATWNLYLDVIDWELGKSFIPMRWFSFRPFAGIKAAWIHQTYDIDYLGLKAIGTNGASSNLFLHLKNNYWGVGPQCGFNSQFWLGKGLSIYGNAGVSLVYGNFYVEHREEKVSTTTEIAVAKVDSSFSAGRAITDLQLGLRWDSNVCKSKKANKCACADSIGKMNFSLSAGWEQHVYFSQGEFFRFTDVSNSGNYTRVNSDLSVQGATVSARLDF